MTVRLDISDWYFQQAPIAFYLKRQIKWWKSFDFFKTPEVASQEQDTFERAAEFVPHYRGWKSSEAHEVHVGKAFPNNMNCVFRKTMSDHQSWIVKVSLQCIDGQPAAMARLYQGLRQNQSQAKTISDKRKKQYSVT